MVIPAIEHQKSAAESEMPILRIQPTALAFSISAARGSEEQRHKGQ
jgi:hypothetical protein